MPLHPFPPKPIPGLEIAQVPKEEVALMVIRFILRVKSPKVFTNTQRQREGLFGFIIVAWKDGDAEPSVYFGDAVVSPEEPWSWCTFNDPTESEAPKIYLTFAGLEKKVQELRQKNTCEDYKIGIALWSHPDLESEPLERYIRVTGGQWEASPRQ